MRQVLKKRAAMLLLSAVATSCACALAAPASIPLQNTLHTVLARADNAGKPFVLIDKKEARLYLYAADGRALGDSPVLLGLARGDDTVPGIGDKPLEQIKPHERTTPAGRFLSEHGTNAQGEDVIWVDYDAAVSMHRVRASNPAERRVQRLATASPADNRISWGCINVPTAFYDATLLPALKGLRAMVYVLPETRTADSLFPAARPALHP